MEGKNENNMRGSSGLMHQSTPSTKVGKNMKPYRQQSLNSKEMSLVSKFKADLNFAPLMNQYTPSTHKIAPSKAFMVTETKITK